MTRKAPPGTDEEPESVGALVQSLYDTGRRIEELTEHEVDGVLDRDGRTFVLPRAQEYLRDAAEGRQESILNALPAHIALLDAHGFIVSVNDAWRRFSGSNGAGDSGHGIGVNYLSVCDQARGAGSEGVPVVATGIRAVLEGSAPAFSIEYARDSPAQRRSFLMTVTPLRGAPPSGAVVMHVDITERRLAEEEMLRFVAAMDSVSDAIYLTDRATMRFIHVNDAACRNHGMTRPQLLALGPEDILTTPRADLERAYDAVIASGEAAVPLELQRPRPDGRQVWVEVRRHARRMGGRWLIITLVRDITARRATDVRLKRLNRVYAVLSGINSTIARAVDRDQLFREATRIAVDHGGFRTAWIAMRDMAGVLRPMASAGAEGDFLATAHLDAVAPMVSNDVRGDPRVRGKEKLAQREILSAALIPLTVRGDAIGSLALYSTEAGFFDDEEVRLLTELGRDLAFAVDHLDKQERVEYLAYYDALTGLPNRVLFLGRVAQGMRRAAVRGNKLVLLLLDLERFKAMNDTLGRAAGDALLVQVAHWLTRTVGDAELLAHVGSDRFAILVPSVKSERTVERVLKRLSRGFLEHGFLLGDATFRVSAKAGMAVFPHDGANADTLFMHAEAALKKAKASGDPWLFYRPAMTEQVAGKLTLENQLRKALDRDEFVLHYQPKANLATGKLTGAEALIRWNDPRSGLVPPGRFIPVLEETGLIHDVGRWALRQALADYLRCRAAGLPAVRIAVNVSPLQLRSRGFIAEIRKAIGGDPRAAEGLEVEITESVVMEDVRHSIIALQTIRAMGLKVAIDDFGTGFSSLSYLAKLPVDTLKIDRSFVVAMTMGPEGLALVSTIINLAHSLKLKVVAEGVETEEQRRLLRLLDCDELQGFLLGRPVAADAYEARFLC